MTTTRGVIMERFSVFSASLQKVVKFLDMEHEWTIRLSIRCCSVSVVMDLRRVCVYV